MTEDFVRHYKQKDIAGYIVAESLLLDGANWICRLITEVGLVKSNSDTRQKVNSVQFFWAVKGALMLPLKWYLIVG